MSDNWPEEVESLRFSNWVGTTGLMNKLTDRARGVNGIYKRLADCIYVWFCVVVVLNDFSDCVGGHWNPLRRRSELRSCLENM